MFGLSAGAGIGALGSTSLPSFPSATSKSTSAQSSEAAVQPSTSRLNSKRAPSESNSESEEEDLGFGDSDYFHDNKYGKKVGDSNCSIVWRYVLKLYVNLVLKLVFMPTVQTVERHLLKAPFSLDMNVFLVLGTLFCCSFFCPLDQPCKTLQTVQFALSRA